MSRVKLELHVGSPRRRTAKAPFRIILALVAAMTLPLVVASPTLAAPPSNDDSTNATVLAAFPVQLTVDLGEATIQGDEPWCGNHVASAWYRYTAPAEQTLTVSVPDTEPNTRICILPDSIGTGTYRFVSPSETVNMLIDAGRTYYILLGSTDPVDPASLSLAVGAPYFDVTVTVDRTGIADRVSGAAIVGGTLRCTSSAPVDLEVRVQENIKNKQAANASDWRFQVPCSTTPTRWEMRLYSNVAYVPGPATVSVWAGGGGDVDRSVTTVKLGAK